MSEPREPNDLTSIAQWDESWSDDVRLRVPSSWMITTRNLQQLLRGRVRPADRFLEIGCAPGKLLSWVAAVLKAEVSGLDYSERGLSTAKRLFSALNLQGDLRCEDLRDTSFAPASFDWVVSYGVIEHFDDPRDVVSAHLRLVKPGGTTVMTVPNYGGLYGRLQRYFDQRISPATISRSCRARGWLRWWLRGPARASAPMPPDGSRRGK